MNHTSSIIGIFGVERFSFGCVIPLLFAAFLVGTSGDCCFRSVQVESGPRGFEYGRAEDWLFWNQFVVASEK